MNFDQKSKDAESSSNKKKNSSAIKNILNEIKDKGIFALAQMNEENKVMITKWAQNHTDRYIVVLEKHPEKRKNIVDLPASKDEIKIAIKILLTAYWFIRWPLDHLFHSDHFTLSRIFRLRGLGPDHFALFTELVLEVGRDEQQSSLKANEDDLSDYVKASLKEVSEIFTNPKRVISEWRDLKAVLRMLRYRVFIENPKFRSILAGIQKSLPL